MRDLALGATGTGTETGVSMSTMERVSDITGNVTPQSFYSQLLKYSHFIFFFRNLRGTQYSEGRPYESYFDYPNDTREDFFLDSGHKQGDVDEQLIKAFEDQHLDDARDHREATDDERPHEQDVRYQEVNYKENKTNKLNGYYE